MSIRTATTAEWKPVHAEFKAAGYVLDYVTAVHNAGDEFIIVSHLTGNDEVLVRAIITDARIDSLSDVFPVANFHERETRQMFGIIFDGLTDDRAAFEGVVEGALRKDFALTDRMAVDWPGAVEPDASARRRPSLPPGVFAEWQS